MTSSIVYAGDLRTVATHCASGNEIITDAPTDNHGKGEAFSPTDLVATAVGSCILTIMGIKARDLNVDLSSAKIAVTKIMGVEPRRITEVKVRFELTDYIVTEKERLILERAALTCPVLESLHPEMIKDITFSWKLA